MGTRSLLKSGPDASREVEIVQVFMVGETCEHRGYLQEQLSADVDIVCLPRSAAHDDRFDHLFTPADALVTLRLARPTALPPVGLLQVPGAGLDGIDLHRLAAGTRVTNVYEHEIPIAEFVVSCLLDYVIRGGAPQVLLDEESWPRIYRNRTPHAELAGSTVGIVGYGRIGRAITRRLQGFDVHIRGMGRSAVHGDPAVEVREHSSESLRWVSAESDFLIVACPLTEQTRGLIGSTEFTGMKAGAVLVNISRAEVVDEVALANALRSQTIAGAFLDVWYQYPKEDGPLAPSRTGLESMAQVFPSPHISAWTAELARRRYTVVADNIERFRRDAPLRNVVR